MLRLLRTRRWIGFTVLVVVTIVAFGLLSRWQWSRAETKRAERAEIEAASAPAAVELGHTAPAEWTTVHIRGEFDQAHQLLVRQRPQGGSNGYWVLTPLTTDDGRTLWVNRGWMPVSGPATKTPDSPAPASGNQEVTGWWRAPEQVKEEARTGLPLGMIGAVDPTVLPITSPWDGYLQLEKPEQAGLVAVQRPEIDDGRNISYAIQWLLFAVVAVVGWWFFLRREAREDAVKEEHNARRS